MNPTSIRNSPEYTKREEYKVISPVFQDAACFAGTAAKYVDYEFKQSRQKKTT